MNFIDLNYKPGKKDLIAEYHAEPNKITMKKLCNHLALESSIGTWTDLNIPSRIKKLKPITKNNHITAKALVLLLI